MKLVPLFLLPFATFASAGSKPQVSCTAVYRTLDAHDDTVERSRPLALKAVIGDQLRHEAELEGRRFTLTEERSGDLFGQITRATDNPQGSTARGALDSLGRFTLAEVAGFTVYRLECGRAGADRARGL